MIKDFTKEGEEYFLQLVRKVANDNWSDFTDSIGDFFIGLRQDLGLLDISRYVNRLSKYHEKILDKNNTSVSDIKKIFGEVRTVDKQYAKMISGIRVDQLSLINQFLKQLNDTVSGGVASFNAESILRGQLPSIVEKLGKMKSLVNPAFDEGYPFGGNQGSPQHKYRDEELQRIVRTYYPNYTDAQIRQLLEELNLEGCGYVAITNTIYKEYAGREDEFEKTFGFPMYKNGELNYDALLVDFYCRYDDRSSRGTNVNSRERMWEAYLLEHNIECDVYNLNVRPDTYAELAEDGEIIIAIEPCILEDENGNTAANSNGGHAMTVVGVTTDGRYIVSSWGEKYYVNPQDNYKRMQFQQVKY